MTKREARAICGGLSKPSKMPGHGYSIPAERCIVGSLLRLKDGSACRDCYARKGNYQFPNVKASLEGRYQSLTDPRWHEAIVTLILGSGDEFFRWHDSGDLQSVAHLTQIVKVCEATPDVRHWLPTREKGIVDRYVASGGTIPDNLTIRLSAAYIDKAAPRVSYPTSTIDSGKPYTVKMTGFYCPARTQGNSCGDCRSCWNPEVSNVVYHKH